MDEKEQKFDSTEKVEKSTDNSSGDDFAFYNENNKLLEDLLKSDEQHLMSQTGLGQSQEEPQEEQLINNKTIFIGCPKYKPTNWWLIFTVVISIYFVFSTFVFFVLLTPIQVVGRSMVPTINADYIQTAEDNGINKDLVYVRACDEYVVNDIVVFYSQKYKPSASEGSQFIKRIVAVGGDVVQFVKVGEALEFNTSVYSLYVNGKLVHEKFLNEQTGTDYTMELKKDENPYFKSLVEEGNPIVVPDNSIFVLGDNRKISDDSKYFGCVSLDDVIGKVIIHVGYDENMLEAIYKSIQKGYLF